MSNANFAALGAEPTASPQRAHRGNRESHGRDEGFSDEMGKVSRRTEKPGQRDAATENSDADAEGHGSSREATIGEGGSLGGERISAAALAASLIAQRAAAKGEGNPSGDRSGSVSQSGSSDGASGAGLGAGLRELLARSTLAASGADEHGVPGRSLRDVAARGLDGLATSDAAPGGGGAADRTLARLGVDADEVANAGAPRASLGTVLSAGGLAGRGMSSEDGSIPATRVDLVSMRTDFRPAGRFDDRAGRDRDSGDVFEGAQRGGLDGLVAKLSSAASGASVALTTPARQVASSILSSFDDNSGALQDGQKLRLQVGGAALKTVQIQLQPETMGKVDITMKLVGGELAIELVAQKGETALRLSEDSRELRRILEGAGFSVDDAAITITTRETTASAGHARTATANDASANFGSQERGRDETFGDGGASQGRGRGSPQGHIESGEGGRLPDSVPGARAGTYV